jgi:hypothetical protein
LDLSIVNLHPFENGSPSNNGVTDLLCMVQGRGGIGGVRRQKGIVVADIRQATRCAFSTSLRLDCDRLGIAPARTNQEKTEPRRFHTNPGAV